MFAQVKFAPDGLCVSSILAVVYTRDADYPSGANLAWANLTWANLCSSSGYESRSSSSIKTGTIRIICLVELSYVVREQRTTGHKAMLHEAIFLATCLATFQERFQA